MKDVETLMFKTSDVGLMFQTTTPAIDAYVASGMLRGCQVGGEFRTTRAAIEELLDRLMLDEPDLLLDTGGVHAGIPDFEEFKRIQWASAQPPTEWNSNGFECSLTVNGTEVPLAISLSKSPFKGVENGGVVFSGRFGKGPQPVVEFVRTADYPTTRELVSIIKDQNKVLRVGEPLPPGYDQLRTGNYHELAPRPWAKIGQCVIAREDDYASMGYHALLRSVQKGWV